MTWTAAQASQSCSERTFEVFLAQITSGIPRKLLVTIAAAALAAVAPIAASAAAVHSSESSTDPNFCDTGASVDVLVENTLAHLSERDGVGKAEHHGRVTFSYGDASVILSFAGQFTDTIVATEAGGVEIHQLISMGIPVKIQLANGPVLSIDAGMIVELVTNGDHEIVSMNGPHPVAESGGSLFCEIIPQALGIT